MRMVKRTALAGCFDHNDDNNAGFMKSKSTLAGCSFSMVLDSAPRSWHLSCGHSLKRENFRSYGTNGIQTEAIWKLWEWFSHLRDDLGGATGPDPGISTWQNQLNKGKARGFKKDKKRSKKLTLAVPCVAADKEDRGFLTWQDRFGCLWYLAMMMTRTMIMIEMLVIMMIVVVLVVDL